MSDGQTAHDLEVLWQGQVLGHLRDAEFEHPRWRGRWEAGAHPLAEELVAALRSGSEEVQVRYRAAGWEGRGERVTARLDGTVMELRLVDAEEGGDRGDGGFHLHCGWIAFVIVPALLVLVVFGWSRWWLVPIVLAGIFVFFFALNLWEDRWRAVTAEDAARGAPSRCAECREELSIVAGRDRFRVRCPICGWTGRGRFRAP